MLKKGLIRTLFFEYIEENKLTSVQQVFDNLPEIYKFVKNHEVFPGLIPDELTYAIFVHQATQGLEKAKFEKQFNNAQFTVFRR